MTVLLSLVTICITVENYRKTSENTKRSIEIASLSTITNITKEYAARINETTLPLNNYGDIQLFLEKFTRLIDVVNKKTDGIDDFKDICVPYFSMRARKEITNITSIIHVLKESNKLRISSERPYDDGGNSRRLYEFRSFNRHAPILMEEYKKICTALDLTISPTSIADIERYIEIYKINDLEKPLTPGDLKRVQGLR
ncbi:hypothetical protein [Komagataeibacter europaeus]|uniref:hypothetical protein n=1 Tax=Komagataeibacter europaeus TaxID=33995 RepID=UPI0012DF109C|nr:hypothetical protein [Komagataeibacter europaeus]